MFNYNLFYLLSVICIPGIFATLPLLRATYKVVKQRASAERVFPSQGKFLFVSVIQSSILAVITADVGTYLMPKTGFAAPFLASLANFTPDFTILAQQIISSLPITIIGSAVFLVAYYFLFVPKLDSTSLSVIRSFRLITGLSGRLLYGGVVEEVLFRWGLMSMLVWVGMTLTGKADVFVMWSAIILTGLLFGLGHIPAYINYGCTSTPAMLLGILGLNMLASVIFGWLFWQYGLEAAMFAHAFLHLVWYPIDVVQHKSD